MPPANVEPVPGVTTILPVAGVAHDVVVDVVAVGVTAAGNSNGVDEVLELPQASVDFTR